MVPVGIEAMNLFGGTAYIDVMKLAKYRNLDKNRFENLLMKEKTVALPFEDPVTLGVNAAKPIVDALSPEERERIEMVITCTESGVDFGKSVSTYIHQQLGLNRNCRLFEVKQACYSGTAGFQMAVSFVMSRISPGAKVLVITSDMIRFANAEAGDALSEDWSFAEPSNGAGSMALLVSEQPYIYQVDPGANGYYGYEVCDTCRPIPDSEAGDSDLSLLSYLDCCEQAYEEYRKRVPSADYRETFQYLAFHTPFGGMIKGAHRNLMRRMFRASPPEIEADFNNRVLPGLLYCQRVGNIMGGTIFLSLLSTIVHGQFDEPRRIGCFSYGSGCCSEFYSGVVTPRGQELLKSMNVGRHLDNRYEMSIEQYDLLVKGNNSIPFGTRNITVNIDLFPEIKEFIKGKNQLCLKEIKEFHREYDWS